MSDAEIQPTQPGNFDESDLSSYRAISKLAIAALVAGLLGWLAFGGPVFWVVPLSGIVLGASALRTIAAQAPALIGRKAALAGMILSLAFAGAAPSQELAYRWLIQREACQFSQAWFTSLRNGQPHIAYQLSQLPSGRRPLDESLWDVYAEDSLERESLTHYVSQVAVRALLTLADKAEVRYYSTEQMYRKKRCEVISQVYAVTYDADGEKTTFFVLLVLERWRLASTGRADWRLLRTEGGYQPKALRETAGATT